jgi:putative CocE/NonD family hydrolase
MPAGLRRSAIFLAIVCGAVWAQKPDPGHYSEAKYQVKVTVGIMVPMRDGIRLSVDVYQPDAPGKFPIILTHTAYDNETRSQWFGPARAKWFAERGYVYAISDFRGRYDSEGVFDIFDAKHKTDGYDLIEWLARQPWSAGKVGMTGPSYMGWSQWWAASQAPPSLKAIAPEVAPPDPFQNGPYQGGILVCWAVDWGAGMMAGRTNQTIGEGAYGGWSNNRAEEYMKTPYLDMPKLKGAMHAPWFETWIRQNLASGAYWKAISYQGPENYSKMTVPALAITGWFDANFLGSPMNYMGMKKYGATAESRKPRLIIGPWSHGINSRELAGWRGCGDRPERHHLPVVRSLFERRGERRGAGQTCPGFRYGGQSVVCGIGLAAAANRVDSLLHA